LSAASSAAVSGRERIRNSTPSGASSEKPLPRPATTCGAGAPAAYPALAPDVTAAGAEFVDGAAVIDGQMVSARAWPDHPAWMREFIGILRSKSPA
jgi:putative intracellular protease/amidase